MGSCDQLKVVLPVLDTALADADGGVAGGEVELSGKAAFVARVSHQAGDEDFVGWNVLAVLAAPGGARVAAGEKAGAAGCAYGTLRECVLKTGSRLRQAVDVGRSHVRIAVAAKSVVALLVAADPEDVGRQGRSRGAGEGGGDEIR